MGAYVIGADIGSSGLKAALVHPERGVIAISEHGYAMHRPAPGWAQNDPEDWFRALAMAVPEVLSIGGVAPSEVVALCVAGQRDIVALLDQHGEVLAPCIHWTDRRDPQVTTELYERLGRQRIIDTSGTLPIPGLVLPNLVWTRDHQPQVWAKVRHALMPKDFIAYRLTGDVGTDPTGPTRSLINDWRTETWSDDLCQDAGIPREILPDVRYRSWEPRGRLGVAARRLGLHANTLLVAGGGDDPCAALGSGVIDTGDVSLGTGSSMSWRVVADEPKFDPTGVLGLMPHVVPGRYLHEMVAVGTGTTLRWLREAFGGGETYDHLIAECETVARGSDGLLCFPYVEGASVPVQDDNARAAYQGISGHHRFPHFVRATLEGIAYQYPALLDILLSRGHVMTTMTISDGEARSAIWNQIKSDVLWHPITPALRVEAPSIGAAILAGLGAELFGSAREAVDAVVELAPVVNPDPAGAESYQRLRKDWEAARNQTFPTFDTEIRTVTS